MTGGIALAILLLAAVLRCPAALGQVPPTPGIPATVSYTSSVDGAPLSYHEYVPLNYDSSTVYPLALLLPGSGGNIHQYDIRPEWRAAADAYGYILVTVQPRTVPGYGATRASFYLDGALVPAEQDVLDVLPVIRGRAHIDPNRTFIAGYSMGGYGALNLAAMNPDVFAAVMAGAAISDLFQEAAGAPPMTPSFAELLGSVPGHSSAGDSRWYQNSPRFLLANLLNTPVRFLHGTADTFVPNSTSIWPYMHGRHIVDTPGFVDARGRAATLAELQAAHPGYYQEEHQWPAQDHGAASTLFDPEEILTFFDAHPRAGSPFAAAFTTYDDRHTRAFWLRLEPAQPNASAPAQVFVTRDPAQNAAAVKIAGSATLTLDLQSMGLSAANPLAITVQPLPSASAGDTISLILSAEWPLDDAIAVMRDGEPLPAGAFAAAPGQLALFDQPVDGVRSYVITAAPGEGVPPTPVPTLPPFLDLTPAKPVFTEQRGIVSLTMQPQDSAAYSLRYLMRRPGADRRKKTWRHATSLENSYRLGRFGRGTTLLVVYRWTFSNLGESPESPTSRYKVKGRPVAGHGR